LEFEKARDYLLANGGKRKNGKPVLDLMAFLRNWMRSDWTKKKTILPPPVPDNPNYPPEKAKRNLIALDNMKKQILNKPITQTK